jgi:hypothetical protein
VARIGLASVFARVADRGPEAHIKSVTPRFRPSVARSTPSWAVRGSPLAGLAATTSLPGRLGSERWQPVAKSRAHVPAALLPAAPTPAHDKSVHTASQEGTGGSSAPAARPATVGSPSFSDSAASATRIRRKLEASDDARHAKPRSIAADVARTSSTRVGHSAGLGIVILTILGVCG